MDVLRENIGLLQLPYEDEYLNEFNLPFRKKSRWQRFKDAIKNNRGKIASAGAGLALGGFVGQRKGRYNELRDSEVLLANKDPDKIRGFNPLDSYEYDWSKDSEYQRFTKDFFKQE